ncbi:MAG: hypothetical protein WDM79_01750 [Terricaulis sp.]
MYHMVWTTGWWENNIAIAHSADLVHWSEQTMLPVMAHVPNVLNSWAPEIFYDEETGEYLIFWSSAVPGTFPETEDRGDIRSTLGIGINHRIYFTKTRDFVTYTPTALFYDGGFVSIDASILRDGERYIMFIKDETKRPEPEKEYPHRHRGLRARAIRPGVDAVLTARRVGRRPDGAEDRRHVLCLLRRLHGPAAYDGRPFARSDPLGRHHQPDQFSRRHAPWLCAAD